MESYNIEYMKDQDKLNKWRNVKSKIVKHRKKKIEL